MSDGVLPASSSNNNNNNLPRGLVSKSGLPFNPNQRLPSLRSSLSKPSLLFQSSASFTQSQITLTIRSPVTKRSYDPSVNSDCVVTRKQGESKTIPNGSVKQGKQNLDWKRSPSSSSSSSSSPSGRGRRQNVKKTKKLIQLESTVFTGASRLSPKKNSSDSVKSEKKDKTKKALATPLSIQELSDDSIETSCIEGKLYQDDFINRSSDENDNAEHLPQGWENLSLPVVSERSSSPNVLDWLSSNPQRDKFILFQLPKMLETQTNTKLGKLRIYESGKIDLVDNPSDLTFEVAKVDESETIIRPKHSNTTATATSEVNSRDESKPEIGKQDYIEPRLNREVVVYSGRNLICLGKLEPDAAIVIPKLIDDS